MARQEAAEAIDESRGTLFDPLLVDCFHDALPKLEAIIVQIAEQMPPDFEAWPYEPGLIGRGDPVEPNR